MSESVFKNKTVELLDTEYLPSKLFQPSTWCKSKTVIKGKGKIIELRESTITGPDSRIPSTTIFEAIILTDEGELLLIPSHKFRVINDI